MVLEAQTFYFIWFSDFFNINTNFSFINILKQNKWKKVFYFIEDKYSKESGDQDLNSVSINHSATLSKSLD